MSWHVLYAAIRERNTQRHRARVVQGARLKIWCACARAGSSPAGGFLPASWLLGAAAGGAGAAGAQMTITLLLFLQKRNLAQGYLLFLHKQQGLC